MSDFSTRIDELSPEKRELLEMLLREEGAGVESHVAYEAPRNPVEESLAAIWGKVLGARHVGVNDNFFDLGGDSIQCMQIVAHARHAGIHFTNRQLFEHPTVAALAQVVGTGAAVHAEQGVVTGPVPFTPIQHWLFEQHLPEPHHWNQAAMLEVREPLDPSLLKEAIRGLLSHHDALRLRFTREGDAWRQHNAAPDAHVPFVLVDLTDTNEDEQPAALERKVAELQGSFTLSEGPLVWFALFEFGAQKAGRLLITAHHLLVDGVSFRILVEDLLTAYGQLRAGAPMEFPAKTTSFKEWARLLEGHARKVELRDDLAYWLDALPAQASPLPVDEEDGENTEASARTVSLSLTREETDELLHRTLAAYRAQINAVLVTALAQAVSRWTGRGGLHVDLEGHGREEFLEGVDLSRTVGWFTAVFPVHLEPGEGANPADALKVTKERLQRIPNRGVSYGLLRYLSGDEGVAARLRARPRAEVIFNYMGQFDHVLSEASPLQPSSDSPGPVYGATNRRPHLLQIVAVVIAGRLQVNWTYSESIHRRETVERVAEHFLEALRALIAGAESESGGGLTPADFPDAELSQEELDRILGGKV